MSKGSEMVGNLPSEVFRKVVATITAAAQKKADADMAHATTWKAAKDREINVEALKLTIKLSKMDPTKSSAFLRDLATYTQALGIGDQLELPISNHAADEDGIDEDDGPGLFDDEGETGRGGYPEDDGAPAEMTFADPTEAQAEDEPVVEVQADWGEGRITSTDIPSNAGGIFNAGAAAAVAGASAGENPYPSGSMDSRLWRDGWESAAPESVEMTEIPECLRVVPSEPAIAAQ